MRVSCESESLRVANTGVVTVISSLILFHCKEKRRRLRQHRRRGVRVLKQWESQEGWGSESMWRGCMVVGAEAGATMKPPEELRSWDSVQVTEGFEQGVTCLR